MGYADAESGGCTDKYTSSYILMLAKDAILGKALHRLNDFIHNACKLIACHKAISQVICSLKFTMGLNMIDYVSRSIKYMMIITRQFSTS